MNNWIPIKYHLEKSEHIQKMDDGSFQLPVKIVWDSEMPKADEMVLITTIYGYVYAAIWDGYGYFYSPFDEREYFGTDGVLAWMQLPKPYVERCKESEVK